MAGQPPTPPTPPKLSLQALGRTVRETYPDTDWGGADDFTIGKVSAEYWPDLQTYVDPTETAAETLGTIPGGQVNLQGRPALPDDPAAASVVARQRARLGAQVSDTGKVQRGALGPDYAPPALEPLHPLAAIGEPLAAGTIQGVADIFGPSGVGGALTDLGEGGEVAVTAPNLVKTGQTIRPFKSLALPPVEAVGAASEGLSTAIESHAAGFMNDPRVVEQATTPFTPAWFSYNVPRTLVANAPLMALGAGVGTAARLAGLGPMTARTLTGATTGLMESYQEGLSTAEQMRAAGASPEAADDAANQTFWANLPVTSPLAAAVFQPFGRTVPIRFLTASGAEGLQEFIQNTIQNASMQALPDPQRPGYFQGGAEAAVLGATVGGAMGTLTGEITANAPLARVPDLFRFGGRTGAAETQAAFRDAFAPGKARRAPRYDFDAQGNVVPAAEAWAPPPVTAPAPSPTDVSSAIPAPLQAEPWVGRTYPPPPAVAGQPALPLPAAEGETGLFGAEGLVNDQPVFGADALSNPEGAVRMGGLTTPAPAVGGPLRQRPPGFRTSGGLAQPPAAAPPPSLALPDLPDLTQLTPDQAVQYDRLAEQALQTTVPLPHQSLIRRVVDDGLAPFAVTPTGEVWATDQRPGWEGTVAVFKPDPEPSQNIRQRFLSTRELLTLSNLATALRALASGAPIVERPLDLLRQLQGVIAPTDPINRGPGELADALDAFLLNNTPSVWSDTAIQLARAWHAETLPVPDPQLLGASLASMAAEQNAFADQTAATPQDRLDRIARTWATAIDATRPVAGEPPLRPRADRPTGTAIDRAQRAAARAQAEQARRERAYQELELLGYVHPTVERARQADDKAMAKLQRQILNDPETNEHLALLEAIADRGGLQGLPEGTEGRTESDWFREFGRGGGRVLGYKVFAGRLSKKALAETRKTGNLRTLEEIHHQLQQADARFEGMDLQTFETKFGDALAWARDEQARRDAARKPRKSRKKPGIPPLPTADQRAAAVAEKVVGMQAAGAFGPPPAVSADLAPIDPDVAITEPADEGDVSFDPAAFDDMAPAETPAEDAPVDAPSPARPTPYDDLEAWPDVKLLDHELFLRGLVGTAQATPARLEALDWVEAEKRRRGKTVQPRPDPHAPFGTPERTAYHREQASKAMRQYINDAGSLNLNQFPDWARQISLYGASLIGQGVRNYPAWAKAMRAKFRWLTRKQIEGVYDTLKRHQWKPQSALTEFLQPTSPEEAAALLPKRPRGQQDLGQPPAALFTAERREAAAPVRDLPETLDRFGAHLDTILALVDWQKIVWLGPSRSVPRTWRVFYQIGQQILENPAYDPIITDLGLTTREELAAHFTATMSGIGADLGKLGDAVQARLDVLLQAVGRGVPPESALDANEDEILLDLNDAGTGVTLPDGTVLDPTDLQAAEAKFRSTLRAMATGGYQGSIFGVLGAFVEQAAGRELRLLSDPGALADVLPVIVTQSVPARFSTYYALRQLQRKHKPGKLYRLANNVNALSLGAVLSQLKVAVRNARTQGIRYLLDATAYGLAGAGLAGIAGLQTLAGQTPAATKNRAVGRVLRSRARNLVANANLVQTWALPNIPWGDSLDELYKLAEFKRTTPPGARRRDVRHVLSLLAAFPQREADFLQYSLAGMEASESGTLGRRLQKLSAVATTLNREQEFAFRSLVTDAVVRSELAAQGVDFDAFMHDNADDLARIGARDPDDRSDQEADDYQVGLSRPALYKHFGTAGVTALDHALTVGVAKGLEATFSASQLPGGWQETLLSIYNGQNWIALLALRSQRPFLRSTLNMGSYLYQHTILPTVMGLTTGLLSAVGAELPRYRLPQKGAVYDPITGTRLNKGQGVDWKRAVLGRTGDTWKDALTRGPRARRFDRLDPLQGGEAIGLYAKAFQLRSLQRTVLPQTVQDIATAQARLSLALQQLTAAKVTLKEAQGVARRSLSAAQKAITATAGTASPTLLGPPPQIAMAEQALATLKAAEQRTADLTAIVSAIKTQIRQMQKLEAGLRKQADRLQTSGIEDPAVVFTRSVVLGSALLSMAMTMRTLWGDESLPWYMNFVPPVMRDALRDVRITKAMTDALGRTADAGPEYAEAITQWNRLSAWMPTADFRGDAPFVQFALLGDLFVSVYEHTDWDTYWTTYQQKLDEYRALAPDTGAAGDFMIRLRASGAALSVSYEGKYSSDVAMEEFLSAFLNISKVAGTTSVLTQLLFGQNPDIKGDLGTRAADALYAWAGAFVSRFTAPLRPLRDALALIDEDEATTRFPYFRGTADNPDAPLGQWRSNVPYLSRSLPERIDPFLGETRREEHPFLEQITGVNLRTVSPTEREFIRIGLTPKQWSLQPTGFAVLDHALGRHYAQVLQEMAPGIFTSEFYQALPPSGRKLVLMGSTGRSDEGLSIRGPGYLRAFKQAAVARTLSDAPDLFATYQRSRATPAQQATYQRWVDALLRIQAEETPAGAEDPAAETPVEAPASPPSPAPPFARVPG